MTPHNVIGSVGFGVGLTVLENRRAVTMRFGTKISEFKCSLRDAIGLSSQIKRLITDTWGDVTPAKQSPFQVTVIGEIYLRIVGEVDFEPPPLMTAVPRNYFIRVSLPMPADTITATPESFLALAETITRAIARTAISSQ